MVQPTEPFPRHPGLSSVPGFGPGRFRAGGRRAPRSGAALPRNGVNGDTSSRNRRSPEAPGAIRRKPAGAFPASRVLDALPCHPWASYGAGDREPPAPAVIDAQPHRAAWPAPLPPGAASHQAGFGSRPWARSGTAATLSGLRRGLMCRRCACCRQATLASSASAACCERCLWLVASAACCELAASPGRGQPPPRPMNFNGPIAELV
jgi:hypothetical protein